MTRETDEPDEQALRRAAEDGDPDAAYRLGTLLADTERPDEAEPWLRQAVHGPHGSDAASRLGVIAARRDQLDEAERWLLVGAHGGDMQAAFRLARVLEQRGRPDEAGYWYYQVAESTDLYADFAEQRLHERRFDEAVRSCVRTGNGPELWRLALSRPLGEAVRIAQHLRDLSWRPAGEPARAVAERLLAETGDTVAAVTERAVRLATRVRPSWLPSGNAGASEARQTSALALIHSPAGGPRNAPSEHRITLIDPDGGEAVVYSGPRPHHGLALLDDGVVMAIRRADAGDAIAWELVRYADGAEMALADGVGAPFPRLATTRHGYVVGLRLSNQVVTGTAYEPPQVVDLGPLGLRNHTDRFAVDPTGTRIAFADDHVLIVTDTEFREVIARAPNGPLDPVVDVVFPAPDIVIVAGRNSLCRWRIEGNQLALAGLVTSRRPLTNLVAVPAWGIVAGEVSGILRCFDVTTVEPVPGPTIQTLLDTTGQSLLHPALSPVHGLVAPPGGRYVVYGGAFRTTGAGERSAGTAIYDTRHPLSWVHRPPAAFRRADVEELGALLASGSSQLAADERHVLELLHAAARWAGTG